MRARTGALSGRLRNTSNRMYVSTGYAVQARYGTLRGLAPYSPRERRDDSQALSFTDVEPAWRIRLLMSVYYLIKAEIIIMIVIVMQALL